MLLSCDDGNKQLSFVSQLQLEMILLYKRLRALKLSQVYIA